MADSQVKKELAVGKSIDEMANSELIKLRFISQDSKEIVFKVKKTIKMGKIMARYSIQTNTETKLLKFLIDGKSFLETATPKSLELEDDDIIEVYSRQNGGSWF